MSYASLTNQFRAKWGKEKRFNQIEGYLISRYIPIDRRLYDTFRYVEPSPDNQSTFSYEYSSILRDAGSVFDSSLRELLTMLNYPKTSDDYNIVDYRRFLKENIDRQGIPPKDGGVETIVLEINSSWSRRFLMPFASLADEKKRLDWWDAYNDVKHSDLEKIAQGNLTNCFNALGAVASLVALCWALGRWTLVFGPIGFFDPMDEIKLRLF